MLEWKCIPTCILIYSRQHLNRFFYSFLNTWENMYNVVSIFIEISVASTWAYWSWKITIFSKFNNPFWTYYDPELEKLIFQYCGNVFWSIELKFLKGNAHVWVRERDVTGKLEYWTFETPEHRTPGSCVNLRNLRGTFHLKPLRNVQESFSLFTITDVFRFDIGQEWKFDKNKNKLILD